MNKPNSPLLAVFIFLLFLGFNSQIMGQEVTQLTFDESQHYDSNNEQFFTINGIGHYSSHLDESVSIFEMNTQEKIYESSFDLCEKRVARWVIDRDKIFYVGYDGIIIEHILDGTSEEIPYLDFNMEDESTSLTASIYKGILNISINPSPSNIQFDVDNHNFLDDYIVNHVFTTDDYYYNEIIFSQTNHFIRTNRTTQIHDTILSGFTHIPGSFIRSQDKYYFIAEDQPVLVIDKDDNIASYDFEFGQLNSAVETSTGKLIFAEIFNGGTVLYELDLASSNLVRKDTLFSDRRINILDSYQDRLYVEYNSNFVDAYGYLDYPYTDVDIIIDDLVYFANSYLSKSQDLFIIGTYNSDYTRNIMVIEKATHETHNHTFQTSHLFLDSELEMIDTDEGSRFIVSEEKGMTLYQYNTESNVMDQMATIDNKRGLGTAVRKNGELYLITNEQSLHTKFEYLHPVTKELKVHEVDGVIHGEVIPFEGNFFYIRNQDFQGIDEDFELDFVKFDPINEDIEVLESKFYYPSGLSTFANINFTDVEFGFLSIFNTNLVFDLKNQTSIFPDPMTKDLIDRIYFESDNYYFSSSSTTAGDHYKIDKTDFQNREVMFDGSVFRQFEADEDAFVIIQSDVIHYITDEEIITITPPENFNPSNVGYLDERIFVRAFTSDKTIFTIYDLSTGEEFEAEVDGFALDLVGDHIISQKTFEPPYEILSTHLTTGEVYETTIEQSFYHPFYKTDTSIYLHYPTENEILILSAKLEEIETIDAGILKNVSYRFLSNASKNPVTFRVNKPKTSDLFKDAPDYSLVIFDPINYTFSEYFTCDSDLRFNRLLEQGPTSTMLLRTKDDGYQLFEVKIPEYSTVSTEEEIPTTAAIVLSPNPTDRFVTIEVEYDQATLYNGIGVAIEQFRNQKQIDLGQHGSGIYYLQVSDSNGLKSTHKIIKH